MHPLRTAGHKLFAWTALVAIVSVLAFAFVRDTGRGLDEASAVLELPPSDDVSANARSSVSAEVARERSATRDSVESREPRPYGEAFLRELVLVRGVVRDVRGRSCAGLGVWLGWGNTAPYARCVLGEDGSFEVRGWPRAHTQLIVAKGTQVRNEERSVDADSPKQWTAPSIEYFRKQLQLGSAERELDVGVVELSLGASIRGRVARGARESWPRLQLVDTHGRLEPGPDVPWPHYAFHKPPSAQQWLFVRQLGAHALDVPLAQDGSFVVENLPPRHYSLGFSGMRRDSIAFELAADQSLDLGEITLEPARKLSGRVLDARGAPVLGAELYASDAESAWGPTRSMKIATSGERGAFSADSSWKRVAILTRAHSLAPWSYAQIDCGEGRTLRCAAGQELVVHVDGLREEERAQLQLYVEDWRARLEMLPDGQGAWRVRDLAPRSFHICAECGDKRVRHAVQIKDRAEHVTLTLRTPATCLVSVVDAASSRALADVRITQLARPTGRDASQATPVRALRTDAEGRARFEVSAGHEYLYSATYPGLHAREPGAWHSAETATVELEMHRPRAMRVRLERGAGTVASGVDLRAQTTPSRLFENSHASVEADGHARFEVLATGTAEFYCSEIAGPLVDASGRSKFAITETSEEIVLVLPRSELVSLRGVVRIDGEPAAGYKVLGSMRATATTDAEGRYEFSDLAFGRGFVALCDARGNRILSRKFTRNGDAPIECDFELQTCSLRGTLRDADGRPLAGCSVHVGNSSWSRSRITGPAGEFELPACFVGQARARTYFRDVHGAVQLVKQELQLHAGENSFDLRLVRVVQMRGQVVDAAGARRKDVHCELSFASPSCDKRVRVRRGGFRAMLPVGVYTVSIDGKSAYSLSEASKTVSVLSGKENDVRLVVHGTAPDRAEAEAHRHGHGR